MSNVFQDRTLFRLFVTAILKPTFIINYTLTMYFTSSEFKSELNDCVADNDAGEKKGNNFERLRLVRKNKAIIEYLKHQNDELDKLRSQNSKLLHFVTSMYHDNSKLKEELRVSKLQLMEKTYNEKVRMEKILKDITVCKRCQVSHSLHIGSPQKCSSPSKSKLLNAKELHISNAKALVAESVSKVVKKVDVDITTNKVDKTMVREMYGIRNRFNKI